MRPNQSRVLIFFGRYAGSTRESGFWWTNPFTIKKTVSLRVRNFSSEKIKVNDVTGNPIEIGAVVVWQVVDSARATFDVDDYEQFVDIQSEIAQAMLRRQQAQAVVAARRLIVEAAVGMVEHALEDLSRKKIIVLDEEKKTTMVNNLMVVLTSEHSVSPVINTGSLYS